MKKATRQQLVPQEEHYINIIDSRGEKEIERDLKQSEEIYKSNIKLLGIKMTEKKKVQYESALLKKANFDNQWWVSYTDNEKTNRQFTFLTIHGAPGDHREWAGLEQEMDDTCRWVNVIIPGFDGQDERRGNYTGSIQDFSQLLIMLLHHLQVSRIIYVGHSLGSILAGYFINKYPQYVRGYVNVTGIVNLWYTGLLTFYRTVVANYGFNKGPSRNSMLRLLDKDQYRKMHHKRFLEDSKDIAFGPVPFPRLTLTEAAAYIKIISSLPGGGSEHFSLNKHLNILRVLIFGKKDPLHEHHKTAEAIYSITRGSLSFHSNPYNNKLIKAMKQELQATIYQEYQIKIQAERIQEYFCYHFDDTGHNAHKRRPKEISRIFKIYMVVLGVMEKYQLALESKL